MKETGFPEWIRHLAVIQTEVEHALFPEAERPHDTASAVMSAGYCH